jgi:hypothetical protein
MTVSNKLSSIFPKTAIMKLIKTTTLFAVWFFMYQDSFAQRDIIYKKDTTQIRCKILKATADKYEFAYSDSVSKVFKTKILKTLVDSIKQNFYDSNLVQNKIFSKIVNPITEEIVPVQKKWIFTAGIGFNVGNVLEFNNPGGTDIKNLSLNTSLDLGLNYKKQGKKFEMTNELHYLFGIQKEGLGGGTHIQKVQDDLATLHDISIGIGKNNKWNFNLIIKSATALFTIFDGTYFKDYNTLGRIKGFASPYDVTVSPGIKFQPNQYFRISLSPYSFNLYGIKNSEITSKGIYITDVDAGGNYKNFLYKRLGAEVNFWYDRRVKEWLDIQYRLGFSSDYFEKIGKNGLMDGLFITKIKIIKDIYLTHRASLKGDFATSPFKPYYNQSILLSYSKAF